MAKDPREPQPISIDAWEQAWQQHWKKAGFTSYELNLPDTDAANRERNFLTQQRTPEREKARLKRIMAEFERGFERLYKLGPAVTVFGSARFKPGHPNYELAREVGANWRWPDSPRSPAAAPARWKRPTAAPTRPAVLRTV